MALTSSRIDTATAIDVPALPMPAGSPEISAIPDRETATIVNDIHSQLNETRVAAIVKPHDLGELRDALASCRQVGPGDLDCRGPPRDGRTAVRFRFIAGGHPRPRSRAVVRRCRPAT